jgi:hypothetical protein
MPDSLSDDSGVRLLRSLLTGNPHPAKRGKTMKQPTLFSPFVDKILYLSFWAYVVLNVWRGL